MSQRSNHLPKLLANVYTVPFKESVQFLFLCKPCVVYSMFPHITQKILTTDTFHWLALIPNSQLSYRYSVWEKQPLGFLKTSEDLQENNKKTVFLVYILRLWKLIKDNTRRCLHCMYSFFLTLETVFHILSIFHICIYHFSFFCFHFTFISLWLLRDTFYNIPWFDFIASRIQFHYNIRHWKFSRNFKR